VHGPYVNLSKAKAFVHPDLAVRVGLSYVRKIGMETAEVLEAGQPYASMDEVVRAGALSVGQIEALATAGAFGSLGLDRRSALWSAGAFQGARPDQLPVALGSDAPPLPELSEPERTSGELWSLGLSPDRHIVEYARPRLDALGVVNARDLRSVANGTRVLVGGAVIHRQRPGTAGGTTFVNLEDETGHINVICSRGVWERYRPVARGARGLIVRGRVENAEGVVNVIADRITALQLAAEAPSRDFH
jgi:error-prone DNA polymerase